MTDRRKAWKNMLLATGREVRVAVLDSGVNPAFPQAQPAESGGRVFDCRLTEGGGTLEVTPLNPSANTDRNGHGSCVQSCLAQAAPEASVDHFRVLDAENSCTSALLCFVLDHVIERDYRVVNLSLGTQNELHVPWLVTIMKRAYERGVVIVAADSNLGQSLYPARFTSTLTASAIPGDSPLALRFNPGSVVEFSAWGVGVPVPGPAGRSLPVSGSSFAAAHLSGLCARLLETDPSLSALDVKLILRNYAQSLAVA